MNAWADAGDLWPTRLKVAASLVLPGESVLDVGAGAQSLRGWLHPSCTYTPADRNQRTPDTVVMDLDKTRPVTFAEPFDVVVLLGVVEYLADPLGALRRCRALGRALVVSYAPLVPGPGWTRRRRRVNGWRNHMTRPEIETLFGRAGLHVETKVRWRDQFVYRLSA